MKTSIKFFFCFLFSATAALAQNVTVNIVSYNTHNCIGMDKKLDYQRIADVINKTSPDIVSLQELDSVTKRNGKFVLQELKERTQMHAFYASAIHFQGGSYGIGILSKEQPLQCRIIPMPGREEKRTMIIAEYKDYVFCATHQSLTPQDQLASIPLIKKALRGIKKPILMAGDMNSQPDSQSQRKLKKLFIPLNDTGAFTFPANKPERCIDYIYAYKKNGYTFNVQKKDVIEESVASDHRPIQVIVRIAPK